MTEKQLIILASQGDERAFRELYKTYDEKLARFVYSKINNPKEAEDILATIWEKIIVHLKKFKGKFEKSFQSWIFTIARNTIFNYYKNLSQREPTVSLECNYDFAAAEKFSIADFFDEEKIHTLIQTLPHHQSKILEMKYFQDLKNKEIAQILNISEKTVASHLCRALKQLSKRYSTLEL